MSKGLAEQIANRCRHFNGTLHEVCKAGVNYQSLTGFEPGWGLKLPCFLVPYVKPKEPVVRAECRNVSFPTIEEAEAEEAETLGRLQSRMASIAAWVCPDCEKPVEMRQVGSCVYGSCGHRMYQGKLQKRVEVEG